MSVKRGSDLKRVMEIKKSEEKKGFETPPQQLKKIVTKGKFPL